MVEEIFEAFLDLMVHFPVVLNIGVSVGTHKLFLVGEMVQCVGLKESNMLLNGRFVNSFFYLSKNFVTFIDDRLMLNIDRFDSRL
ncbi:MAG: hypothetical protein A2014_11060 [Spirochaetes bacterium GWF1_49_6]|nr:MAG: hypothetical protein A2014_11060 [Spirochaetes bacterium GWF1_49_6]